jgi:hypothetical protein
MYIAARGDVMTGSSHPEQPAAAAEQVASPAEQQGSGDLLLPILLSEIHRPKRCRWSHERFQQREYWQ